VQGITTRQTIHITTVSNTTAGKPQIGREDHECRTRSRGSKVCLILLSGILADNHILDPATTMDANQSDRISASSIIKSSATARGRKSSYEDVDSSHKRSPSVSSNSSADSIATISTNRSRSRSCSPPPRRDNASRSHRGRVDRPRSRSRDQSHRDRPSLKPSDADRDKFGREGSRAGSRRSRSPLRRHRRRSPSPDRPRRRELERSRSRSPYRQSSVAYDRCAAPVQQSRAPSPPRERSLSPFSKRQALTRAHNQGR
jgi:hypothetical protein